MLEYLPLKQSLRLKRLGAKQDTGSSWYQDYHFNLGPIHLWPDGAPYVDKSRASVGDFDWEEEFERPYSAFERKEICAAHTVEEVERLAI